MTAVLDTSVLLDLIEEGSQHHAWSTQQFQAMLQQGPVLVPDIVYAEFSVGMAAMHEADEALKALSVSRLGSTNEVLFRAGKAFLEYKRNRGPRDSLLPDFLIGALAEVEQIPLLTRDPAKVSTYFPTVEIISP